MTPRRDAMGVGLAVLNKVAGAPLLDRLGLRKPVENAVYQATRTGFKTAGAAGRRFAAARAESGSGPTRLPSAGSPDLFDLTPTEEQSLITGAVRDFAARELRPAAAEADESCHAPDRLVRTAANSLGLALLGIPGELGGAGAERSTVTNVLVAEALAHGDLGLAVALLAPAAVSTAISLWGDEQQQSTYLPAFVGDNPPTAALAVLEPTALFDPFALRTTARRSAGGYVLSGTKSLVPNAATAELFVVAADLHGSGPALFLVEAGGTGLSIEAEPSMGLRAANLGRVLLDGVVVAESALIGGTSAEDRARAYTECIRLSRLGWSALSLGTCQAVLDYVIGYVNERIAFGEPVSNRQSVAFMVANIGIELEGMRLATYRAASLAEQGRPHARQVALARRLCAEYCMKIGSDGVQLLGGHGFVKEHPVERWYRDLRAIAVMEGAVLV
jgi:alkylation response protein AidB-like acyl-CoA dehydrogenase